MAIRKRTNKRKTTPVRRRRTTTAKATPRRRRSTTKKGMLSELFNPAMAQASAKTVISGAVGGAAAGLLSKVLPDNMDPKTKNILTLGAGFLTATVLKMPNVGAGMSGVGMYNLLQASMLSENYNYADEIESLPAVLNEGGAMDLQEGGMYLQENGMYLQEDNGLSYDVGYYGAGFGMDNA